MPTLADVKMRIPAGQPVVWNGYPYTDLDQTATVMMPGPVASSVWAVSECGNWVCLKWSGKRQAWLNVTRDHVTALDDQRQHIVDAMVATELRLRGRRYAFVPGPEHATQPGESDSASWWRVHRAEVDHDLAVLARLRAEFWGRLYGVTRMD